MSSRAWRAFALAGFLPWLLAGCGGGSTPATGGPVSQAKESGEDDAIVVDVAPVEQRAIASAYSTSATLRAERRTTVIARTAGVIEELLVEEGDLVREGQPLARLEDEEQRFTHQIAVTARETTRRELERAESLLEQGLLSPEEHDAKRRAAEEARHQAGLAQLTLSRTVIRAPFTGRILVRLLDIGATVQNGTAIYELADLTPLYADVQVPERHVVGLAPGQGVRLRADATGQAVSATIQRVAHQVDPETGTVKVTLAVSGAAELRPGAFVRVEIVTDVHENALVVPRAALVSEGADWHLFRVAGDEKTAEQIEVQPGFEEENAVEVIAASESGKSLLAPGDRVVVAGAAALNDGASVRLMDDTQTSN
jgi:membrane fusion protein, multidrug efflux system